MHRIFGLEGDPCRKTVPAPDSQPRLRVESSPVPLAVPVGPSTITINRDDRVVVCQPDARIEAAADGGFFARDTRSISGYELLLNGRRPLLLNSSPVEFFSSRFEFTNPELLDIAGPIE